MNIEEMKVKSWYWINYSNYKGPGQYVKCFGCPEDGSRQELFFDIPTDIKRLGNHCFYPKDVVKEIAEVPLFSDIIDRVLEEQETYNNISEKTKSLLMIYLKLLRKGKMSKEDYRRLQSGEFTTK